MDPVPRRRGHPVGDGRGGGGDGGGAGVARARAHGGAVSGVVIAGGGLTGLVAAERLAAAGVAAVVLEREAEPGGACRSLSREGFTFDLTGHLLHVAREETRRYLEDLGVWDSFAEHERRSAVVVRGRITPYPASYTHLPQPTTLLV
ncbi:MAG: NAD(P)/FAD-dependent oxidoreductase [Nitrospirae bacterium]|nr:MAG: NAD(P)/FAD-dependent oxidoreductase [Nitrospirota bacterium]